MRVPISWLREYVDLPRDTDEIAHRLAMLGFPVEDVVKRPEITGVVVGKIVELQKHPDADRLQVGTIDIGGEKTLTVATAATNVANGQVIPVATIGARLPQLTIEPRKMRGIASEGMMVSADELALPSEWFEDGIMQLEPNARIGDDVVTTFGLRDDVLDVEVTSNRVDAMCVIGLARELAASYGVELAPTAVRAIRARATSRRAKRWTSQSSRRIAAVSSRSVSTASRPDRRRRGCASGWRSLGNVRSIISSTYRTTSCSKPDSRCTFTMPAKISGGRLVVRDGREGEKTVTLDDVERTLSPQSLVIADDRQTLCLAGLMGAAAGEVDDSTTSIVLEAANFNGARVRRMSKALGLRSEASSRHEKSLPVALTDAGAARAAQLLVGLGATAYRPRAFGGAIEPHPQDRAETFRRQTSAGHRHCAGSHRGASAVAWLCRVATPLDKLGTGMSST